MALSKERRIVIIIFFIATFIAIIFYWLLPEKERTILNGFTLFGTMLSIVGIGITYFQIKSVSRQGEETKIAIDESLLRINQIVSVADLSKAVKIIQEIQSFILHEKQEVILIRMKDLKLILIQLKYNKELIDYTKNAIYTQNITDLGSNISNLQDLIMGNKKGFNFSALNKNLEHLITTLSEFENKLKYKDYDTRKL